MAEEILVFENVSKCYGKNEALRRVCLSVKRGQCIALTGRNGSGKTTLLRIAAGLTRATSGTVRRISGVRIQFIPEAFPPLGISARSLLNSLGKAEGIPKARLEGNISTLLAEFSLEKESVKPLRTYSKGMLQKVSVIQAFLSQPDLLLLDEPLSGQDAQAQAAFIRCTKACKANGAAVILACHERHLIDELGDRVFEIREGALAEKSLSEESGRDCYTFAFPDGREGIPQIPVQPGIQVEYDGGRLYLAVPHGTGDRMLQEMLEAGGRLREMRYEKNI